MDLYRKRPTDGLSPVERTVVDSRFAPSAGPVLDIGCGTGRTTRPLFEQGFGVTGAEDWLQRETDEDDVAPGLPNMFVKLRTAPRAGRYHDRLGDSEWRYIQTFLEPRFEGYKLDWCRRGAEDCGEPAARAWAERRFFHVDEGVAFEKADDTEPAKIPRVGGALRSGRLRWVRADRHSGGSQRLPRAVASRVTDPRDAFTRTRHYGMRSTGRILTAHLVP